MSQLLIQILSVKFFVWEYNFKQHMVSYFGRFFAKFHLFEFGVKEISRTPFEKISWPLREAEMLANINFKQKISPDMHLEQLPLINANFDKV